MRLAIIGRTKMLLDSAYAALDRGHEIAFVATAKESAEAEATAGDFQRLARLCNCSFFAGPRFHEDVATVLKELQLDLGLTMNWPSMINEAVTKQFKFGIVNAHGSDLPKYRGNACPNWAIINGERQVGLTFHMIDPHGLDTGPIVHKEYMDLTEYVYIGDVYDWFKVIIPQGFVRSIELLGSGIAPTPQHGDVIRAYPRRPEDGRIDWGASSHDVHRLIRASSRPFPGAFCYFSDDRVVVWKAKIVKPSAQILAIPGQVLWFQQENPVVACGDGAIELTELSCDGCAQLSKSLRARFS